MTETSSAGTLEIDLAPEAVVARAAELLRAREGDRVVVEFAPHAEPLSFFVTNRATAGGAVR